VYIQRCVFAYIDIDIDIDLDIDMDIYEQIKMQVGKNSVGCLNLVAMCCRVLQCLQSGAVWCGVSQWDALS